MILDKYAPRTSEDLFLSKENVLQLKRFILERKPVILHGDVGCGKTTAVYVLAKELGYELFELNASDNRSKNSIEGVLGPSLKEGSLFAKGRLILIDDIEALSGTKDRGGVQALTSLLGESRWPIVITTSDAYNDKLSKLRRKCGLIEHDKISDSGLFNFLKNICEKEGILYDADVLQELAEMSRGDIRAALNDLETFGKDKQLDSLEHLGERERKENIHYALNSILTTKDFFKIINSFQDANIELDEALLWLDENLPRVYNKKEDIALAYENLSKADIFKRRIRRWQYWRFLVYQNFFLTAGITFSRSKEYNVFGQYKRSGRLLKLFWAKQKNMKKKAIAEKIAEITHSSTKRVMRDDMLFVQLIYKHGDLDIDLSDDEKDWLKNK